MGSCGLNSKNNAKPKLSESQLHNIQQIIDQNFKEIIQKNPQILMEELEKEQNDIQKSSSKNERPPSVKSEGSIQNNSSKTTLASINSKQEVSLVNAIVKRNDIFYTQILQKEVFKLSSNLQKYTQVFDFTRNVVQQKRIQNEIRLLVKNLPIFSTHSIFVRCDELDTNHFQCLIMGTKGTPYAYGAFLYDLYCDYSFPSTPPKMKLITTGQGNVRFNPSLYKDGYICLSILGTWTSNKYEKWIQSESSIFQILLSIQSLVMSDGVYYNEPNAGKPTAEKDQRNRGYKNIVKIENIRYAMIDQLRNPTPAFKDVIKMHFYLNKDQILKECDQWILDAKQSDQTNTKYKGYTKSHNFTQSIKYKNDYSLYYKELVDIVYELKQELLKIDITTSALYQEFVESVNSQEEKNVSIREKQESCNIQMKSNDNQSNPIDKSLNKIPNEKDIVC